MLPQTELIQIGRSTDDNSRNQIMLYWSWMTDQSLLKLHDLDFNNNNNMRVLNLGLVASVCVKC